MKYVPRGMFTLFDAASRGTTHVRDGGECMNSIHRHHGIRFPGNSG
jgi:hypothetical protein